MVDDLLSLPNIGNVLAGRLREAGINTPEELMSTGSEKAFLRLKAFDNGACLHELMALEGAIQGIRWHSLDAARKAELKEFHRLCSLRADSQKENRL